MYLSTYTKANMIRDLQATVGQSEALTSSYLERILDMAVAEVCLTSEVPGLERTMIYATSVQSWQLFSTTGSATATSRPATTSSTHPGLLSIISVKCATTAGSTTYKSTQVMSPISRTQADAYKQSSGTGQPLQYLRYGNNLEVYPAAPTSGAGAKPQYYVRYVAQPMAMSNWTASTTGPWEAWQDRSIIQYALFLVYQDINEPERAAAAIAAYQGIMKAHPSPSSTEYAKRATVTYPALR